MWSILIIYQNCAKGTEKSHGTPQHILLRGSNPELPEYNVGMTDTTQGLLMTVLLVQYHKLGFCNAVKVEMTDV